MVTDIPDAILSKIVASFPHLKTLADNARSVPSAAKAIANNAINGSAQIKLTMSEWNTLAKIASGNPSHRPRLDPSAARVQVSATIRPRTKLALAQESKKQANRLG